MTMEYRLLGWPADGPTLDLDHREFSYAGKFVMSSTGKLVARAPATGDDRGEIVGATAFDEDRTDDSVLRIRYVTVREGRQGDGVGTTLLQRTRDAAIDRGYEAVRIAVNNPFAYEAAYRAGFGYTGEETGIAELVLRAPSPDADRYHEGLRAFRDRDLDLSETGRAFIAEKLTAAPPPER
jgi:GNAT superfamily N-acetyltransferase